MNKKIPRNIVIVEDDVTVHIILEKILKNLGHHPSFANNISSAKKLVEEQTPHLIIVDIFLGGEDGFDFVKYLKFHNKYHDIPIIMMSSTMTKELIIQSMEHGVTENIAKPIQNKILIQKIRKILNEYKIPSVDCRKLKNQSNKVNIKCHGDIIRINEVSCVLKSPLKFLKDKSPTLESNFLDYLGASKCKLRSVRDSAVAEPGEYNTELTFLGMNEKTATKIRKIKIIP